MEHQMHFRKQHGSRVVMTLAEFPTIDKVQFMFDGKIMNLTVWDKSWNAYRAWKY